MPQTGNREERDESISLLIKTARETLGLTQADAATKWGINLRTLQNWESARSQPRGLARTQLEKLLAEILDAPAEAAGKRRKRV